MTPNENGDATEVSAAGSVTFAGSIRVGDDRNLVDDVLDAVGHESLVDRCVAAWQVWRASNEASAESLDRMREADGLDIESDPIEPEAQLCATCGVYPATWQGRCFGCGARLHIATRRGIA